MNKFSGAIFDGRLKQEHLLTKANPDIISQGDNKNEKKKKKKGNVTNVWFRLFLLMFKKSLVFVIKSTHKFNLF